MDALLIRVHDQLASEMTPRQRARFTTKFLKCAHNGADFSQVVPLLMLWLLAEELPRQWAEAASDFASVLKQSASLRERANAGKLFSLGEIEAEADMFEANQDVGYASYRISEAAGFAVDAGMIDDPADATDVSYAQNAAARAVDHASHTAAARRRIVAKLFDFMAAA
jgi:hypothetical protein